MNDTITDEELRAKIEKATAIYNSWPAEKREAHDRAQRISWVQGEMRLAGHDLGAAQVESMLVLTGALAPRPKRPAPMSTDEIDRLAALNFPIDTIPRLLATIDARDKTIAERDAEIARLREALRGVLEVSRDRKAFVLQGPRAFAKAEQIARKALGTD